MIKLPENLQDREKLLRLVQHRYDFVSYQPKFPTELYEFKSGFHFSKERSGTVQLVQQDSLQAAQKFKDPLVLILADDERPGGNFLCLAGMQEESLFLRSALFRHLTPNMYPIHQLEALYAEEVALINGNSMSFIACPGLKFPHLDNGKFRDDDRIILTKKIELIFQVAQRKGHTVIVLSALGCGVFGCPAKEVAEIFWEIVAKHRMAFDHIVFAILGGNYRIFRSVFDDKSSQT